MINKEQLKEIILDLKNVLKSVELEPRDYIETIISEACSYQRGLMCGENRTKNTDKVNTKPFTSENKAFEPATEKQVNFLKKIKKYQEGMSKQEAFKIIQALSNKKAEY